MLKTLSHIFHRIYYYDETVSSGASIVGKITVQVGAASRRDHFSRGGAD
jgi:hypothetical protein